MLEFIKLKILYSLLNFKISKEHYFGLILNLLRWKLFHLFQQLRLNHIRKINFSNYLIFIIISNFLVIYFMIYLE
jgi:hypothetical protein